MHANKLVVSLRCVQNLDCNRVEVLDSVRICGRFLTVLSEFLNFEFFFEFRTETVEYLETF